MAMVEYICKKCGMWFFDDETETTHYQKVDNEGIDHGPCGGEGEPQYVMPENFRNFGPVKKVTP